MGALRTTAAEKNRRKRERKKQQQVRHDPPTPDTPTTTAVLVESEPLDLQKSSQAIEIEYIEPELPDRIDSTASSQLNDALDAVRRFQARATSILQKSESSTDNENINADNDQNDEDNDDKNHAIVLSKRKLREVTRPSVAQLKRQVQRPDLVEAHDITAADPIFLIQLKSIPNTVPVPRHWGRKRKYLQGKRIGGQQTHTYQLPKFLVNTGIAELRDTVMESEKEMSAKQKNRARVQVKLGAIDIDYRTLHDAFFKHQTKPNNLTKFGDVYYEGKEFEMKSRSKQIGQPLSKALQMALGMSNAMLVPPPWLINMQRYGPPPSYPNLRIPGLNAPLPDASCQYGYHPNGWGKPPIDIYGRPLYGGNPFDPPGSSASTGTNTIGDPAVGDLVTSDGKTIAKGSFWGELPTGVVQAAVDESSDDDDDDDEDDNMEESSVEEGETALDGDNEGMESTLPPPSIPISTGPVDLRKSGLDTPLSIAATSSVAPPQQLYRVIEQKQATIDPRAVFASEMVYAIPTTAASTTVTDGAESVLTKVVTLKDAKEQKSKNDEDDDDDENIKNFKF
jgi:splicing factor 3B subunit 2